MTNGDCKGQIFLSHPILFLLTTKYFQKIQKILKTLRCDMVTSYNITMTSQVDMQPACSRRATVCVYLSHKLSWVCEIELSQMGKNNGNPDLVCKKIMTFGILRWIQTVLETVMGAPGSRPFGSGVRASVLYRGGSGSIHSQGRGIFSARLYYICNGVMT